MHHVVAISVISSKIYTINQGACTICRVARNHGPSRKHKKFGGQIGGQMARNKLTAVTIRKSPAGKLFDGAGLYLIKTETAGRWVYRYTHLTKRRDMGLGSFPALSLADARTARDAWEAVLADGNDPIDTKRTREAAAVAERDRNDPTFAEAAQMVFEARKATLKRGGIAGRWLSPLIIHVIPKLGGKKLSQIHQTDIREALAPIWRAKYPTAIKAIQRTRIVFDRCRLMGFDCDPFVVDAAREMLGNVAHVAKHITATQWENIPALYARLDNGGPVDQCLRWMILTAVRMDGCSGARLSEINGDVWTVPADRIKSTVKGAADFRVPLSAECHAIASAQAEISDDLLFGSYTGRRITSTSLELRLNKLGEAGRPHGFRTSFRTWASDTDKPWDVAETVLGHKIGGRIERTYARSDLLDRRAAVMASWARHVTGEASSVVALRG